MVFTIEIFCLCGECFNSDSNGNKSKCPKCNHIYEWCCTCNKWKLVG